MPDDLTDSFRRFARDLRRIREDRDISLSAVQEATQVHRSHLESFESGTLYEESRMNDVYLKAFVRAYAEAIALSPDTAIEHLEMALEGTYEDRLVRDVLRTPSAGEGADTSPEVNATNSDRNSDSSPPSSSETDSPPGKTESAGDATTEASGNAPDEKTRDQDPSVSGGDAPPSDRAGSSSDRADNDGDASGASSDRRGPREETTEPRRPSTIGDTAFSQQDAKSQGATTGAENLSPETERWRKIGMAAGLLLLLAVGGGLLFMYAAGDGSSPGSVSENAMPGNGTGPSSSVPPPDTTASDTTSPEPSTGPLPPASVTLGDTIYATVLATADVLELRVQQDAKLRRPYWIEEGEAMVFPFTDRITLQNQLDNFQLLLEGYPYPTSWTDAEGRVVIRRDTARQFVDTLRGEPVSVPAPPDTTWGDGPPVPESDTLDADPLSSAVVPAPSW